MPASDFQALQASRSLAETYRLLITTAPVLDRVEERLGLDNIRHAIDTSIIGDTQLIEISVTDTDPAQATRIANTLAEEFQRFVEEQAARRAEKTQSGLDAQIEALEERLRDIDERIAELEEGPNAEAEASQRQIADLTQERTTLSESLSELNATAATMSSELIASSAQVEIVDPATPPETPFSPRPMFAAMLGMALGLLISAAVVALLEYLDNTVKPEDNLEGVVNAPVLATVASLGKLAPGAAQVYTITQPQSSAAEALRLLRTNLEFASTSGPIDTLTVTSPNPSEGKSTITANLGVVMAQAGLTALIIDADLRKPTQHRIFGVDNRAGLTTLLTHPDSDWHAVTERVALPGLMLMPSGPLPPNPADLVTSGRFEQLLERVKQEVDLVIIDSPPVLSASDSLAIAAHTDGLLMVCLSHGTRIDALRHAVHAVRQGGIRVVGLVLNRQRGQRAAYYYGEYYGPVTASSSNAD